MEIGIKRVLAQWDEQTAQELINWKNNDYSLQSVLEFLFSNYFDFDEPMPKLVEVYSSIPIENQEEMISDITDYYLGRAEFRQSTSGNNMVRDE